jgi:hypothetical protein
LELERFWAEEISRAIEALEKLCVDQTDLDRWKNFHANITKTIDTWKVQYCFLFCHASLTDQNVLFRQRYQVFMFKPYIATVYASLRFAHFCFGILLY